jgi:hypothetical protein
MAGAKSYDNSETQEGRAFVYHGSSSGLSSTANWTAESNQTNAEFGCALSTAGDVNGDGYSDIVIGAAKYSNGHAEEGGIFVYHGSSTGLQSSVDWTAESGQPGAFFGYSVSTAGDINGDGYSDVIAGASCYDHGQIDEGRAFVYYGNGEAGRGLSLRPQVRRGDDSAPVQTHGIAEENVRITALGRTPYGRSKVKLECEVKPFGTAFNGTGTSISAAWTDTGTAGTVLNELISGMEGGLKHWRARLLYNPSTTPYQSKSRWFSSSFYGMQAADFRLLVLPAAPSAPAAIADSTSQITWSWTDNSNNEDGFKVYADPGSATPTTLRHTTVADVTNWPYTGLAANTEYSFQAAAANYVGDSAKTSVTTEWTHIEPVTGLSVSGVSVDGVTVSPSNTLSNLAAGNSGLQYDWGDATNSGWLQHDDPVYHDYFLANTPFTITINSRNGAQVESASYSEQVYTGIEPVAGLTFSNITENSAGVAASNTPSHLASGSSGLFYENTTAGTDSSWLQNTSPWVSSGLTANTQYSFSGRSRNGEGLETSPVTGSMFTLASAPSIGNSISCDRSTGVWCPAGTDFTFSNPTGFGTGGEHQISAFNYAWNESAEYTFTGSESQWNSGTLIESPGATGSYYLHLQSCNAVDTTNPVTLDYGPFMIDTEVPVSSATSPVTQVAGSIDGTYTASDTGGSGLDSVHLYVREPGLAWADAGEVTGGNFSFTPTQVGTAADGVYYFQAVASDGAGNSEAALSGTSGAGDSQTTYNDTPNSSLACDIAGTGTYTFPMEAGGLDVQLVVNSMAASPGIVTVTREENPGVWPAGHLQDQLISERLCISSSTPGDFDATILWDYQLDNGLNAGLIQQAIRDTGAEVTEISGVSCDGTTITIPGVTGFSDWYAGTVLSVVEDWRSY